MFMRVGRRWFQKWSLDTCTSFSKFAVGSSQRYVWCPPDAAIAGVMEHDVTAVAIKVQMHLQPFRNFLAVNFVLFVFEVSQAYLEQVWRSHYLHVSLSENKDDVRLLR